MLYALVVDEEVVDYPYSYEKLRRDNPGTSFPREATPDIFQEWGLAEVTESEKPEETDTLKVVEVFPLFIDGQWVQTWEMQERTDEETAKHYEIQASRVRGKRNVLLSESDFTQLADSTVDKLAWANYRQALRDIPDQEGFPYNIVWPTMPGE